MQSTTRRIIITCGPSFEPIDEVRCITNSSTGELGVLLSEEMSALGVDVICFKGRLATFRDPLGVTQLTSFDTNANLLENLQQLSLDLGKCGINAIYHIAALCDYRVADVGCLGAEIANLGKLPTDMGKVTLELVPTIKLLPLLRQLFPEAMIIGWKLEYVGNRETTIQKALNQLRTARSDECVVNGPAYGTGFGLCNSGGLIQNWDDKRSLCRGLAQRLLETLK